MAVYLPFDETNCIPSVNTPPAGIVDPFNLNFKIFEKIPYTCINTQCWLNRNFSIILSVNFLRKNKFYLIFI
jgi:hypothetical protein